MPLLDSLPRFIRRGRGRSVASNGLLDNFIRFATTETNNKRAGSQSILNQLSELMFVEVIRMHMNQLAENNTGWLGGLRDLLIGHALSLLHGQPAHAWTVDELAAGVAASRSTLADRFAHLTGHPPIQYLTQWHMQLAACNGRGGRLRLRSGLQPRFQEGHRPLAERMAVHITPSVGDERLQFP